MEVEIVNEDRLRQKIDVLYSRIHRLHHAGNSLRAEARLKDDYTNSERDWMGAMADLCTNKAAALGELRSALAAELDDLRAQQAERQAAADGGEGVPAVTTDH